MAFVVHFTPFDGRQVSSPNPKKTRDEVKGYSSLVLCFTGRLPGSTIARIRSASFYSARWRRDRQLNYLEGKNQPICVILFILLLTHEKLLQLPP